MKSFLNSPLSFDSPMTGQDLLNCIIAIAVLFIAATVWVKFIKPKLT